MDPLDLSIEDIRTEILRFKNDPDVQKLQSLYYSKSFSEILGVSRRELSHSKFLAWILTPDESHALGFFSIKKFLEVIARSNFSKPPRLSTNFLHAIITDDARFKSLDVHLEKSAKGFGRVDIYIESDIEFDGRESNVKFVIENKVESKESNDQTAYYFE